MKNFLVLCCLVITPAFAQDQPLTTLVPVTTAAVPTTPRWSPPAEHHQAAVIISTPDGSQGSGVLIKHTGKGIIALTNRHVVRIGDNQSNPCHPEVTLRSQNGNRFQMKVLATDINLDVALLKSVRDEITARVSMPLGNFEVPRGGKIELVGFGGPESRLRHFYGERLTSKIEINAITISGDSGSPMIYGGAVVGINYGGRGPIGQSQGWDLIYPASSFISGPILCQWVNQRGYQYGQCQPYIINEPQYSQPSSPGNQGSPLYPPSSDYSAPPTQQAPQPPVLNPPTSPTPAPSTEDLVKDIVSKILASPEFQSLRGKDGIDGKDGLYGKDGQPGPIGPPGSISEAQVAQIIAEVTDRVSEMIPDVEQCPSLDEIVQAVLPHIQSCTCAQNQDDSVANPPVITDDNLVDDTAERPSNKYLESNRVLYFTANSCTYCFETTNLVNSLKRSGYPITIITLTTSMAEANQVPQIFVPATGQRALGPTRVKEFLSSISL